MELFARPARPRLRGGAPARTSARTWRGDSRWRTWRGRTSRARTWRERWLTSVVPGRRPSIDAQPESSWRAEIPQRGDHSRHERDPGRESSHDLSSQRLPLEPSARDLHRPRGEPPSPADQPPRGADEGTPRASTLAPELAPAPGFLEVDPAVLVPGGRSPPGIAPSTGTGPPARPSSRSKGSRARPIRGRAAGGGARSRGTRRSAAGRSLALRTVAIRLQLRPKASLDAPPREIRKLQLQLWPGFRRQTASDPSAMRGGAGVAGSLALVNRSVSDRSVGDRPRAVPAPRVTTLRVLLPLALQQLA
jgi:hypothetical protein